MTKTILFDLDGTLLPLDTDELVRHYMQSLVRFMAPYLPTGVSPGQLPELIMASTYAMVANADPAVSNEEAFWADFTVRITGAPDLAPHFVRFYEEAFPALKVHFAERLPGLASEVVEAAVNQGFEIVLATNPVFPRAAIVERMRWLGIDRFPWRLVTVFEEMHFCKPQPGYFLEICSRIGRRPEECLMVGNDLDEDGVAAKVGMQLFVVTDYLINKRNKPLDSAVSGSLGEFLNRLRAGEFR